MYFVLLRAVVKMVKNTHKHPANQALHFAGAPLYAVGLAIVIGHFAAGIQADLFAGLAMCLSAIAMFVAGHSIEGNIMSMTPVLLFRLFSRKAAGYLPTKRLHLV
jgi:hypothetical protein